MFVIKTKRTEVVAKAYPSIDCFTFLFVGIFSIEVDVVGLENQDKDHQASNYP